MSEEITKGLVAARLGQLEGYSRNQNESHPDTGIVWFKEDSFATHYIGLRGRFKRASKTQNLKDRGFPDFLVLWEREGIACVIECKAGISDHGDLEACLRNGYGSPADTKKYAINGALWYAGFLKDRYDIIAIGVSGQKIGKSRVTSFFWPKGRSIETIGVLEDGTLADYPGSIMCFRRTHWASATESNIVLGNLGQPNR